MAKINLNEPVHVSITVEGEAIELDLITGDNDVEQVVADLLIAQGIATETSGKNTKKTSPSIVVEEPVIESKETN